MKPLDSKKGVSPILATLLLIIIVVAIGLTLYAWVTGYTGTQTGRAAEEIVCVASLVTDGDTTTPTNDNATLYLRNTGGALITIVEAYVSTDGISWPYANQTLSIPISVGSTDDVVISGTSAADVDIVISGLDFEVGRSYWFRFVTAGGNVFTFGPYKAVS